MRTPWRRRDVRNEQWEHGARRFRYRVQGEALTTVADRPGLPTRNGSARLGQSALGAGNTPEVVPKRSCPRAGSDASSLPPPAQAALRRAWVARPIAGVDAAPSGIVGTGANPRPSPPTIPVLERIVAVLDEQLLIGIERRGHGEEHECEVARVPEAVLAYLDPPQLAGPRPAHRSLIPPWLVKCLLGLSPAQAVLGCTGCGGARGRPGLLRSATLISGGPMTGCLIG